MRSLEHLWRAQLWKVVALWSGIGLLAAGAAAVGGTVLWGIAVVAAGVVSTWLLQKRWRRATRERLNSWLSELSEHLERFRHGAISVRLTPADFPVELQPVLERLNDVLETVERELGRVRRLERVRSDFLGNVSHELRNPLFVVQGYLEALAEQPPDSREEVQRFARTALSHAQRLGTLLTRLLELSQIESGAIRMRFRVVALTELAREVLDAFATRAQQKNVQLLLEVPPEPVEVIADRERIEQVLSNLVDNAIKYNRPGGTVWLRIQPEGKRICVEVADTGIGIPKEHQERVFERFYRVREGAAGAAEGSGLGLAIVKHILAAHQAPYELESEPGVGTRIRFWLRS